MFIWKKEFELGIASIDEQHKHLFKIGNRINELLKNHQEGVDDFDHIYDVIEELKNYTIYHFNTEEELFLKYDYPDYEVHKKEHEDFIAFLESVSIDDIDQDQKAFIKSLLEKIVKWVFNHIMTTDFLYKDYLIKLGAK